MAGGQRSTAEGGGPAKRRIAINSANRSGKPAPIRDLVALFRPGDTEQTGNATARIFFGHQEFGYRQNLSKPPSPILVRRRIFRGDVSSKSDLPLRCDRAEEGMGIHQLNANHRDSAPDTGTPLAPPFSRGVPSPRE
jgi:hypothetical protein